VAPARALPLREAARGTIPPVPAESPTIPAGWDVLSLGVDDLDAFAHRLLDFSPSVVVLGPHALLRTHVDLLRRTAAALEEARDV
jgi:proteasome accessory factor B